MEQGGTPNGRPSGGTRRETARTPEHLLGLRVRITVECTHHGSHSLTMKGPFLKVIDFVTLFRDVCADNDRWVICEYCALDYVPALDIGEWE